MVSVTLVEFQQHAMHYLQIRRCVAASLLHDYTEDSVLPIPPLVIVSVQLVVRYGLGVDDIVVNRIKAFDFVSGELVQRRLECAPCYSLPAACVADNHDTMSSAHCFMELDGLVNDVWMWLEIFRLQRVNDGGLQFVQVLFRLLDTREQVIDDGIKQGHVLGNEFWHIHVAARGQQ